MTVLITTTFDGYPDGKTKRMFLKGETVTNLSPEYEDLIRAKGHAERVPPKNPPPPTEDTGGIMRRGFGG